MIKLEKEVTCLNYVQILLLLKCPRELEENVPISSTRVAPSVVSATHLLDTNLEASIPDTYRAPPAPLPYNVGMVHSQTLPGSFQNCGNKTDPMQPAHSQPGDEADGRFQNSDACDDLAKPDCKAETVCWMDSPKLIEDEPPKLSEPIDSAKDEEDVCPTCLEEYDLENPRILTKCEHHFHLSCILEWMERSDTCPICDQIMVIEHASIG